MQSSSKHLINIVWYFRAALWTSVVFFLAGILTPLANSYNGFPLYWNILASVYSLIMVAIIIKYRNNFPKIFLICEVKLIIDHIFVLGGVVYASSVTEGIWAYMIIAVIGRIINFIVFDRNKLISIILFILPAIAVLILIFQGSWGLAIFVASVIIPLVIIEFCLKGKIDSEAIIGLFTNNMRNLTLRLFEHDLRNFLTICQTNHTIYNRGLQLLESLDSITTSNAVTSFKIKELCRLMKSRNLGRSLIVECDDTTINSNKVALGMIITNLVDNAYEADAKEVKLKFEKGILSIIDNGRGFDTSKIKLGVSSKRGIGHGKGLFYSLEICKNLKITVKIISEIGFGTTITMDFNKKIIKNTKGIND